MSLFPINASSVYLPRALRFIALLLCFYVEVGFSAAQTLAVNGQAVAGSYTNGAPAYVSYSGITAGQYVCISLTTNAPDAHFIPEVGFPGSLVIGSRYGSRACGISPASSGQIEIYNYSNPAYMKTFGYAIQLTEPKLPYAGGGGIALTGITNSGSINGLNVDLWTFSALKDDTFRIQFPITNLQNCTSDFCAQTILVNPDGTLDFESGAGGTPGGISYRAPQSGTYYLYVYSQISYSGPTGGNYSFTINLQSHAPPVTLLDPITTDPSLSLLAGNAVTADKSKLAQGGSVIRGVAADGNAEMVIRIEAASLGEQFTISQNGGDGFLGAVGSTLAGQGDVSVTADYTVDNQPYAFALYRAPVDFVRKGSSGDASLASRSITLTVTPVAVPSSVAATVPIAVLRPPVVLIHGLWSNANSWNMFTPLINSSVFDVERFDYSATNAEGFRPNAVMFAMYLQSRVRDFAELNLVASTQADVVAHSMGGDITRSLDPAPVGTYGKGNVHKLITIGTPHLGSPLARELAKPENSCLALGFGAAGNFIDQGAIVDLVGNGDGTGLSSALQSLHSLPAAKLAGQIAPSQIGGLPFYTLAALTIGCDVHLPPPPLVSEFSPATYSSLMGYQGHDGVVPLRSALNNGNGDVWGDGTNTGAKHSRSLNSLGFSGPSLLDPNSVVSERVVELLSTPVSSTEFQP